jgi:hypothetical protein
MADSASGAVRSTTVLHGLERQVWYFIGDIMLIDCPVCFVRMPKSVAVVMHRVNV